MTVETDTVARPDVAGALIAHRGASLAKPENTLAALREAKAMGCDWVEIDAQLTRDGDVVLMHDYTVDRTTDGSGPLAMMSTQDCRALRTLDPRTAKPTTYRVPLLSQAISTCLKEGLGLVLEFKNNWGSDLEDAEAVAAIVRAKWPRDNRRLIVTCFSAFAIARFHELCPWVKTGLACLTPPPNPARLMDRLGVKGFHVNHPFVTPENLKLSLDAGAEIAVATVNDAATARRFLDMGADGIITDRPDLLG